MKELQELHPEALQDLQDWDARFADTGKTNPHRFLQVKSVWVVTFLQWNTVHDQKMFTNEQDAQEHFDDLVENISCSKPKNWIHDRKVQFNEGGRGSWTAEVHMTSHTIK